MDWAAAGKHELIVDFVMLLVHYMDNAFSLGNVCLTCTPPWKP
jgi:hypothetical protein